MRGDAEEAARDMGGVLERDFAAEAERDRLRRAQHAPASAAERGAGGGGGGPLSSPRWLYAELPEEGEPALAPRDEGAAEPYPDQPGVVEAAAPFLSGPESEPEAPQSPRVGPGRGVGEPAAALPPLSAQPEEAGAPSPEPSASSASSLLPADRRLVVRGSSPASGEVTLRLGGGGPAGPPQAEAEAEAVPLQQREWGRRGPLTWGQFFASRRPNYALQLFGTASTWLLLDVAFYSQNLFQKGEGLKPPRWLRLKSGPGMSNYSCTGYATSGGPVAALPRMYTYTLMDTQKYAPLLCMHGSFTSS